MCVVSFTSRALVWSTVFCLALIIGTISCCWSRHFGGHLLVGDWHVQMRAAGPGRSPKKKLLRPAGTNNPTLAPAAGWAGGSHCGRK